MAEVFPVLKDDGNYTPVPTVWRRAFVDIVEAFKEGDFALARNIPGVRPLSLREAAGVAASIEECRVHLASLPEETWQTSVCLWAGNHWDVVVDLYTKEGRCDLILDMKVYEDGASYAFEFHLVYVP